MRKTGKTGIGLALAKEIVRLHKGTICAYNDDTGAVFEIDLPPERQRSSTFALETSPRRLDEFNRDFIPSVIF